MGDERDEVSAYERVDTNSGGGSRRRRRWPSALKQQIVAETRVPGASVSVVARRHDVNANQLFKWRREFEEGAGAVGPPLVPVSLRPQPRLAPAGGTIEIELVGGARVCVSGVVDGAVLRQVLEVLR